MTNEMAARAVVGGAQIFAGAMILAGAFLAPRNKLFGVRIPAGFRSSAEGRRAVAAFRTIIAIPWVLGLAAILLGPSAQFRLIIVLAPVATVIAAVAGYATQHRRLKTFALPRVQTREVELTLEPDRLPWFMWLWPGPLAMLAGAARYLSSNWDGIPEKFPLHWGIDGQPNRWGVRSFDAVYGPLILCTEIVVWQLVLALASWFGARRSPLRRPVAAVLIAIAYSMACAFGQVSLHPLIGIPPAMLFAPIAIIAPAVIYLLRKTREPRDSPEPTAHECWKRGILYYNRNDAALMVETREGAGVTINFGNPWSWAIAGLLAVNVAALFLFPALRTL
jgi:uncharacterized membrane protein